MKDLTVLREKFDNHEMILPEEFSDLLTRLEQAEAAVERVREVATGDPTEYGWSEAMLAVLRALGGDTRG